MEFIGGARVLLQKRDMEYPSLGQAFSYLYFLAMEPSFLEIKNWWKNSEKKKSDLSPKSQFLAKNLLCPGEFLTFTFL